MASNAARAYEFERFSAKEVKQEKFEPQLTVVKTTTPKALGVTGTMKLISGIIVVVAVVSTIIYSRAVLTEISSDVNDYTTQLTQLQSESKMLTAEIESKVSLRNIEDKVVMSMGLSKMDEYQVKYISLSEGDKLEISAQAVTDKAQAGENVGGFFQKMMAYIGLGTNKN